MSETVNKPQGSTPVLVVSPFFSRLLSTLLEWMAGVRNQVLASSIEGMKQ